MSPESSPERRSATSAAKLDQRSQLSRRLAIASATPLVLLGLILGRQILIGEDDVRKPLDVEMLLSLLRVWMPEP